MNYSFHPEARKEFLDAVGYYESCREGLVLEFSNDIYSTIQRIINYPRGWSEYSNNTRRCLAKRFPFGVIYQNLDKNDILVIAVISCAARILQGGATGLIVKQPVLTEKLPVSR